MEMNSSAFAQAPARHASQKTASSSRLRVFTSTVRFSFLAKEDRAKTAAILESALARFGVKLFTCSVHMHEEVLSVKITIDDNAYESGTPDAEKKIDDFVAVMLQELLAVTQPGNVSNIASEIDASENFLESQEALWNRYKALCAYVYPFYGRAFATAYEQRVKNVGWFEETGNKIKAGSCLRMPSGDGSATIREIMLLNDILSRFVANLKKIADAKFTLDEPARTVLFRESDALLYWLYNSGCGAPPLLLLRNALLGFDMHAALLAHDSLIVKLSKKRELTYAPREKANYIDLHIIADSFSNDSLPPRLDLAVGMVLGPLQKAAALTDTLLRDRTIRVTSIATISGGAVLAADLSGMPPIHAARPVTARRVTAG